MPSVIRIATGSVIKEHITLPVPQPAVDFGGAGLRAWTASIIGSEFETWDMQPGPEVSRRVDVCSMREVKDKAIGTALCVSLLEHVRLPWRASRELHRVLKPGGLIIVTVPFKHDYHKAPDDYWRFSPMGLRVLFEPFTNEVAGWINKGGADVGAYFIGRKADH